MKEIKEPFGKAAKNKDTKKMFFDFQGATLPVIIECSRTEYSEIRFLRVAARVIFTDRRRCEDTIREHSSVILTVYRIHKFKGQKKTITDKGSKRGSYRLHELRMIRSSRLFICNIVTI
jgi:hypothetical protein